MWKVIEFFNVYSEETRIEMKMLWHRQSWIFPPCGVIFSEFTPKPDLWIIRVQCVFALLNWTIISNEIVYSEKFSSPL